LQAATEWKYSNESIFFTEESAKLKSVLM